METQKKKKMETLQRKAECKVSHFFIFIWQERHK